MEMIDDNNYTEGQRQKLYECPSVTADVIAFGVREAAVVDNRRLPEAKVSVLLVRRGKVPFKGYWAIPGGFLKKGENLEKCARREIMEETGLAVNALIPIGNFSDPGRDPRGWIISNAYIAIIEKEHTGIRVCAGDDAADARWFAIDYGRDDAERVIKVELTADDGEKIVFRAEYNMNRSYVDRLGQPNVKIVAMEGGDLAFDHAKILVTALLHLGLPGRRKRAFAFLPQTFTMAQLQQVYEFMRGRPEVRPNFRRKMLPYLQEVGKWSEGIGGRAAHRPAGVYKWTGKSPE